jgi:8-oxo-dGTP diphosphatase/2-hydroxy-dATP diphosphatase
METKKRLTLAFIRDGERILLGMKKRGFGMGRWNGFGGKVQPGEGIVDACRRELAEECGVTAHTLEKRGILDFKFAKNPNEVLEVHVFLVTSHSGEPTESEEMRPQWFPTNALPFSAMWPDDPHWMPLFLRDATFRGVFLFGDGDAILEQSLAEAHVA